MINFIELKNFQSHKNTLLNFSEGVNTIIGPSDSGKTAVLRALKWTVNNRPSGEAFRSHWGGDTSVKVGVDDKWVVRGKGGKAENWYRTDNIELTAFGRDVPKAVTDIFNLSELNMQSQMDAPFLLSSNSGDVAKVFNKAANLDIIDTSLLNISKKGRAVSQGIKEEERRFEQTQEDLKQYENLDGLDVVVTKLEDKDAYYQRTTEKGKELTTLLTYCERYGEILSEVSRKIEAERGYKLLEQGLREWQGIVDDEDRLGREISDAKKFESTIRIFDKVLVGEEEFKKVELMSLKLEKVEVKKYQMKQILYSAESELERIKTGEERLDQLEEEYHEKMPDECPLCGLSTEGEK